MLIVQDDTGLVVGANGYITNAQFRTYMDDRARAYLDDDDTINAAIIAGSDYVDSRFRYKGRKLNARQQRQQWPRISCMDADRQPVWGIPQEVKDACCEYTARAISLGTGNLNPDPVRDPTGQVVSESKQSVGPIDVEVKYAVSPGSVPQLPTYPAADFILKRSGFALTGGDLLRA